MASPKPFVPPAVESDTKLKPVPVNPVPPEPPKAVPTTGSKVIGAKIELTYLGSDGKTYIAETVVDPKEFRISSYGLNIDEKYDKKKQDGDLVGFEDTGERILTFKLRYHVR